MCLHPASPPPLSHTLLTLRVLFVLMSFMLCIIYYQALLEWAAELREDEDEEEDVKNILAMSKPIIAQLEELGSRK